MRIFKLKLWSALLIFSALFITSCGTTKYQELGFGGGNSSFASEKSNKVSESHKIQSQTGNLLAAESISETESMASIEQTSVFGKDIQQNEVKGGHHKTTKVETMVSKFIQKRYPLISKVKPTHTLIKMISGSTSTSLEDPKPEIKKSKWPNSKSSFWKWLLTILGLPIFLIGSILILIGIFDRLLGGEVTIYIGLIIAFIGFLILRWARNIN